MFDKQSTPKLLKVQTRLRVRMIEQGELSTKDSTLYLALTQTLDQRASGKDRWLV
jgi:hypothetical protein